MRLFIALILSVTVWAGAVCAAQDTDASSPSGHPQLSSAEMIRRVFAGEQKTIATFAKSLPIVETYLQSLQPGSGADVPIDDAYFLSRVEVNVDPGRHIRQQFLFGNLDQDRIVRIENSLLWSLHPDGYVEMLFVDLADFDDDEYKLHYEGNDRVGEVSCARFSVAPRDPKEPGRFVGEIWAETSKFRIVRIKGIFSPHHLGFLKKYFNPAGISGIGLYLHFESWRQEIAPGEWVPSYVYFEEKREGGHRTGELAAGFHYRGHVFAWGYQSRGENWDGLAQGVAATQGPRSLLSRLEDDRLLARPKDVEQRLTAVIRELLAANNLREPPIDCRILLTTPVELFRVDRTVVISRGLLNLLPDDSVLTVLLAHEVAHILVGRTQFVASPATSLFVSKRHADFPGLDMTRSGEEEAAVTAKMRGLLGDPQYQDAMAETEVFLSQVARVSSQVPNLMRGRFGTGLVRKGRATIALPNHAPPDPQVAASITPELRGQYGVDSSCDCINTVQIAESPRRFVGVASEPIDTNGPSDH